MPMTPDRFDELLLTSSVQASLPFRCEAVWRAVESLVEHLCVSRVVVAEPPRLLVHAVASDTADDPDGWLTWTLAALSPTATHLTVSLSEPRDGAPPPELDLLLCQVIARSVQLSNPASDPSSVAEKESS